MLSAIVGSVLAGLVASVLPLLVVTRRQRLMRRLSAEARLLEALPEGSAKARVRQVMNSTADDLWALTERLEPQSRRERFRRSCRGRSIDCGPGRTVTALRVTEE